MLPRGRSLSTLVTSWPFLFCHHKAVKTVQTPFSHYIHSPPVTETHHVCGHTSFFFFCAVKYFLSVVPFQRWVRNWHHWFECPHAVVTNEGWPLRHHLPDSLKPPTKVIKYRITVLESTILEITSAISIASFCYLEGKTITKVCSRTCFSASYFSKTFFNKIVPTGVLKTWHRHALCHFYDFFKL